MPKQKIVRIGFIGQGPRGRYLMTQMATAVRGARVVAACDKFAALVAEGRQQAGDETIVAYTDHRALLKDPSVEAVFLVVAPEHNADLAVECLAAGKHVLCEVPLALTIRDCWRVVLAAEKSGCVCQMAEQARYHPFAQAWKKLVQDGRLGKILWVEGQYLHGVTDDRYYQDAETGRRLPLAEARNNPKAIKSRFWNLKHPIYYLPHELSPFLNILGDRVRRVSCLGTRKPSYYYDWFPMSDIEVALMHTEQDVIMRMAAGFTVPTPQTRQCGYHWYHLMGTRGKVETNRSNADKMKLWEAGAFQNDPLDVMWDWTEHDSTPEQRASGHGGVDVFPMLHFVRTILDGRAPAMAVDVYRAAEITAPALLAGASAERQGAWLDVPSFRPDKNRKPGRPLRG